MKNNLTRRDFLKASGGALAGVYVLGLAGCGREQGGGHVQGTAADLQASEGPPLRIMCWNISEGSFEDRLPDDSQLPEIVEQLRAQNPDIILLNEACRRYWWSTGINQVRFIAQKLSMPYYHWGDTRRLGFAGWKVNGVISRYPLGPPTNHPGPAGFNTLEVTASINNMPLRIFSTRFAPQNSPENVEANKEGHSQAIDLLRRVALGTPVIFGGDFNARTTTDQFKDFVHNSGLANAFFERPETEPCEDPAVTIDHIFYRGPYKVTRMELRCPWPGGLSRLSTHPWVLVELSKPDNVPLRGYRSLQSLNYPTRFVRHAWSLGELTEIHSDLDRRDATFKIVPGLADSSYVSFESVNYPNHFLRHQDDRLKLHPRSDAWLFKADATFLPIGGLADASATSFRSYNYPARHLRHRDLHLWVEGGSGDFFRDHANDATFRVVDPFLRPSDTTPPDTTIDAGPPRTTESTSASFAFSSNEPDVTFECSLDGAAYSSCTSPKRYTGLGEGGHTFSVRAADGSGNVDPTPARRSWTVLATCPPPPADCP